MEITLNIIFIILGFLSIVFWGTLLLGVLLIGVHSFLLAKNISKRKNNVTTK